MLQERIKKIREYLKIGSQKDFAKEIGWPIGRIQDLESGKVKSIKAEEAELLQEKFLINGWWLFTGKGSMLDVPRSNIDGYEVDMLDLKASAGTGIMAFEVSVIGKFILDKAFFKTPQHQENIKIIEVQGDSMEPTIQDGAFVVIDVTKCDKTDGIYAILLDNNVLIKRLQFNLDGTIKIISDNGKYEAKIYNAKDDQVFFKILGRKVMTIQR
nr:MAG TPA: Repressor protein CI [Caudoviricetes sp.]